MDKDEAIGKEESNKSFRRFNKGKPAPQPPVDDHLKEK